MGKKKITALAVLFLGVVGSFLIIRSSGRESRDGDAITIKEGRSADNASLLFKTRAPVEPQALSNLPTAASPNTANLTQALADAYTNEIFKRNADGLRTEGDKQILKVPNEELATQMFEKSLDKELDSPRFTAKDIKVVKDDSQALEVNYIQNLATTFRKNFGALSRTTEEVIHAWFKNQNSKPLEEHTERITGHINDLLTLAPPERWQEFHLLNLNLWQKQYTVLQALTTLSDDPLKAAIALQSLSDIAEESKNLRVVLSDRLKDLAL